MLLQQLDRTVVGLLFMLAEFTIPYAENVKAITTHISFEDPGIATGS